MASSYLRNRSGVYRDFFKEYGTFGQIAGFFLLCAALGQPLVILMDQVHSDQCYISETSSS